MIALDITNLPVTDASLESISGLRELQLLSIGHTSFSQLPLADTIRSLKGLRYLYMHDNVRGELAWQSVATLGHLEVLDASNSDLIDSELKALSSSKLLREIYLHQTKVSRVGILKLLSLIELDVISYDVGLLSCQDELALLSIRPNLKIRKFDGNRQRINCLEGISQSMPFE